MKMMEIGEEVLKQKARLLAKDEIELKREFINELIEQMHEEDGVGIAAPQVGVSESIVVMEVEENENYPEIESMPLTVMINPKVTPLTDEKKEGYEGCLSVPGIRAKVPRYTHVQVEFLDENGKEHKEEYKGFPAIVVQHETDHLEGIVFLERVEDMKTIMTYENYKKYVLEIEE